MGTFSPDPQATPARLSGRSSQDRDAALHELLTVDDVAAVLKVSKSWVYEHTRVRGTSRAEQLPHIKVGKYLRFDLAALRRFIANKCRTT